MVVLKSLGKVNRPTMFFYLAVATSTETKSGAKFFAYQVSSSYTPNSPILS